MLLCCTAVWSARITHFNLSDRIDASPFHFDTKGTLIEKKLATSIMSDPEIQELIKNNKVATPEFKEKVLAKTLAAIKTDPAIQADFAKKMFNSDKFGRTLNESEQGRLLNFILNKPEVLRASGGEPSLRNKSQIMEAAKNDLKDIYAKWEAYKARRGVQ